MVLRRVRSESRTSLLDVIGKGLLVGLVVGASSLVQASPLSDQAAHVDADSAQGTDYLGTSARTPTGVSASFATPANFSGAVSITPNWQSAPQPASVPSAASPQLISAKPAVVALTALTPAVAPGPAASLQVLPNGAPVPAAAVSSPSVAPVVAPTVSAPITVVSPGVQSQQIVAAAPPAPTATAVGSAGPTTPVAANTPLTPGVSLFAVPDSSTIGLLFGGFLALIGIRRNRAASN